MGFRLFSNLFEHRQIATMRNTSVEMQSADHASHTGTLASGQHIEEKLLSAHQYLSDIQTQLPESESEGTIHRSATLPMSPSASHSSNSEPLVYRGPVRAQTQHVSSNVSHDDSVRHAMSVPVTPLFPPPIKLNTATRRLRLARVVSSGRPHQNLLRHPVLANTGSTFDSAFSQRQDVVEHLVEPAPTSAASTPVSSSFIAPVLSKLWPNRAVPPPEPSNDVPLVIPITSNPEDYNERVEFLIRLLQCSFSFGEPVYRVSHNVLMVARVLQVDISIAAFPTYVMLSVGTKLGETQLVHERIHIFSGESGLNCQKLYSVDQLIIRLVERKVSFEEADGILDDIIAEAPLYPDWLNFLALSISSAMMTPLFFSGSWIDAAASFFLGMLSGLIMYLPAYFPAFSRLSTFAAASLTAFLAAVISSTNSNFCFGGIVFSAIIWNLPGLSLTIAVLELSTKRNLVSGTSRFFGAIIVSMQIGFGINAGTRFSDFVLKTDILSNGLQTSCSKDAQVHFAFIPFMFVIAVLCWNLLLNASVRQWPAMLIISAVGFTVTSVCGETSSDLATVAAAVAVGIASNLWARYTSQPSVILIISGVLLLVPGGLSVKSVAALLSSNGAMGLSFAIQMIVIALSITVGVSLANVVVFPREELAYQHF